MTRFSRDPLIVATDFQRSSACGVVSTAEQKSATVARALRPPGGRSPSGGLMCARRFLERGKEGASMTRRTPLQASAATGIVLIVLPDGVSSYRFLLTLQGVEHYFRAGKNHLHVLA